MARYLAILIKADTKYIIKFYQRTNGPVNAQLISGPTIGTARIVRGSDYSPAIALSEEKDILRGITHTRHMLHLLGHMLRWLRHMLHLLGHMLRWLRHMLHWLRHTFVLV